MSTPSRRSTATVNARSSSSADATAQAPSIKAGIRSRTKSAVKDYRNGRLATSLYWRLMRSRCFAIAMTLLAWSGLQAADYPPPVEGDFILRDFRFASGEVLPTRTVVWAAGVRANPLAEKLGLPTTTAGRIEVDPDLSVPGFDRVWAIGDAAAALDRTGGALPQLAPVAMQGGAHVARQIARTLEVKPTQPSVRRK